MESVDAVKLVYQSAFGCGHLLSENCARRVAEELARTPALGDVWVPPVMLVYPGGWGGGLFLS